MHVDVDVEGGVSSKFEAPSEGTLMTAALASIEGDTGVELSGSLPVLVKDGFGTGVAEKDEEEDTSCVGGDGGEGCSGSGTGSH